MWSPVQNGKILKSTGVYGCRPIRTPGHPGHPDCPVGERWHAGLDIGAGRSSYGAPVYAVERGEIEFASGVNGNDGYGGYGKVVLLKVDDDGETLYILYSHLSAVYVTTGQTVEPGKVLGLMGNTAGSLSNPGAVFMRNGVENRAASHLHFEVSTLRRIHSDGRGTIDPLNWLHRGGVEVGETPLRYIIEHGVPQSSTVELGEVEMDETPMDAHERFWLYLTTPSALAEGLSDLYRNALNSIVDRVTDAPMLVTLNAAMFDVHLIQITNATIYTHFHMLDYYTTQSGYPRISRGDIEAMDGFIVSSNTMLEEYLLSLSRGEWLQAAGHLEKALEQSRLAWRSLVRISARLSLTVTADIKKGLVKAAFDGAWEEWKDLYGYVPDVLGLKPKDPKIGFGLGIAAVAVLGGGALYIWAKAQGMGRGAYRRGAGPSLGQGFSNIGRSVSGRVAANKQAKTIFVKAPKAAPKKYAPSKPTPIGSPRPSSGRRKR